jgi:hypothetical protein
VGFDDALGQRVIITQSGMIKGLRELSICRPGPFCKGPGIYKQVVTFARHTEYLPRLESVAFRTCTKCKAASIYLFSAMPGPSLLIKTHAKLQKVLQCFANVDITPYI